MALGDDTESNGTAYGTNESILGKGVVWHLSGSGVVSVSVA